MAFFKLQVRVYSNFASLFSVMKDNSSVIFSSNLILWTEIAHWSKILQLLSGWVKIHKIPDVIFETTSHFFFKLRSWKITLLYFFSWNFILFWRREPMRMLNFRLSISPNCNLISSFCWKYIKFQLKSTEVLSHDTFTYIGRKFEEKLICCFKTDKIFWWIFIRALKSLKNLYFDWFLAWKLCNVWSKKVQRSFSHDTREWCKIWRKTNMWFGK